MPLYALPTILLPGTGNDTWYFNKCIKLSINMSADLFISGTEYCQ